MVVIQYLSGGDDMIDLDVNGLFKYNQLKSVISPKYTCFPNNLSQAWEIYNNNENCWKHVKNYHDEYKRIPDKLTYFTRFENAVREIYKLYYPKEYNDWIKDPNKDKDLYSNDSYPPNEVFKVMVEAFNLFLNIGCGDVYAPKCTIKHLNVLGIKNEIDDKKPVVSSFKLGDITGHIMTIKGYDDEGFIVYDTYGCSYLNDFESVNHGKRIKYDDFIKICKPLNSETKLCVCFI